MNHARAAARRFHLARAALRSALGNCGIPAHQSCPKCDKAIDEFLAACAVRWTLEHPTPSKEEVSADDSNTARD